MSTEPASSRAIRDPQDEPLLDAFYRGLYLDAFAHQREELALWKQRLWSDAAPYELAIRIVGRSLDSPRPEIHAGIVYERYRRSSCGLVTYLVVAPEHQRKGLGQALLSDAIADLASAHGYVFAEVSDPTRVEPRAADAAWRRVELFQRWGARAVDAKYIQPRLDPSKARDRALRLLAFSDQPCVHGEVVARFLDELFAITEGCEPDAEVSELVAALRGPIPLVELARP
jgi:GNAT superfamily N-acetyltransferase